LICHDESTYKSGEISSFRWLFPQTASFYNKGQGRSLMHSKFLVQHENDFFQLNEEEWIMATSKYPCLLNNNSFLNYRPRSADACIIPKKDNYFDNDIILCQFETLFQLLEFKTSYKDYEIEVIVDNARTHSAKMYDVKFFNKNPATNCQYECIAKLNGLKMA